MHGEALGHASKGPCLVRRWKGQSGDVKLILNMRRRDGRTVADDKRETATGVGGWVGGGEQPRCCAVRDNEFKHKPKVKQETWMCVDAVLITFTNTWRGATCLHRRRDKQQCKQRPMTRSPQPVQHATRMTSSPTPLARHSSRHTYTATCSFTGSFLSFTLGFLTTFAQLTCKRQREIFSLEGFGSELLFTTLKKQNKQKKKLKEETWIMLGWD